MSYLRDYLTYASGNEAPELFHVWAGYAALSAAISRKVWLPFEDEAIFPNIYVMLVGKAGNGKSWALRKAKRVLAELEPTVHMTRSVETPEGLWRFMNGSPNSDPPIESPVRFLAKWPDGQLRECHPMTIMANEFVNFISQNQVGWVNALNDIYDEDKYEYRTKNMGEDNLIGPYIVLLGALTTEVSSELQKTRIISTGLARRTIFQHGERQWYSPVPKPAFNAEQQDARKRVVTHLNSMRKKAGEFKWTPEVNSWWINWYNTHLPTVPKKPPQTQSWYASKSTQLLKIGMLTCLSESDDLTLQVPHFEVALAYLEEMEKDLYRIFGGVGRNELASVAGKIYDYIINLDEPISRRVLKAKFFMDCKPPTEFDDCINFLLQDEKIKEVTVQVGAALDAVLATPPMMDRFVARVNAQKQSAAPRTESS